MFGRKAQEEPETPPGPPPRTTPTSVRSGPAPAQHKSLGELLIEEGTIERAQLDAALEAQKSSGGFIGQILVQQGAVTQEQVASCLVKQCKIPHLSLLDYDIGSQVLSLIPEETCLHYRLLPIDKLGSILTVAMVDPLDMNALEAIRQTCPQLRIKPILCNWQHFELVAAKVFGKKGDGGSNEVTAASLGLAPRAPIVNAPPSPGAAPQPPSPEPAKVHAETPAAQPAGDVVRVIRDTLRDTLRDTMGDMMAQMSAQRAEAAPAPPVQDLAETLKETMREAVAQLAQTREETPAAVPVPAPSSEEIAQMIQEGVGDAMQEAIATLVVQMRANGGDKPHGPDLDQFADVIRDSIGGAMEEAMAALLVQLRAGNGRKEDNVSPEVLAEIMRESVQQAVIAAQAQQQDQGKRLTEIAEAALQSVQQASLLVETTGEGIRERQKDLVAPISPFITSAGKVAGADADLEALAEADAKVRESLDSDRPQEALSFSTFIPGSANTFTFKLAQAVATKPGTDYNPFFLFGNVGVGKTHLISAIGNAISEQNPELRVGYVSASHFARKLLDASKQNAMQIFREGYCHWDVLILDDIQFLAGKVEAQEEFFHVFNVLHQAGRQIIIASDKAPDRLGLLEKRLVSRFGSGIVCELKAPEWETRLEILRQFSAQSGTPVQEEILSLVAMRVPNDVRRMTGSMRKVLAYSKLVDDDLTIEMADEILSHLKVEAAA